MINNTQKHDVLVVGGGMAGLKAVLGAKDSCSQLKVSMLVPGAQGEGGCSKKTHGINAAVNSNDTWEQHYTDTMKGGGWINNPALATLLCRQAPERIRELESWGVVFDKIGDQFDMGMYAGSSQGRSIHWNDQAGRQIVQTLVRKVTERGVYVLENRWALQLIVRDKHCDGIIVLNMKTKQLETHLAKAVVLATGGGACIYPIATISSDKLATGMIMAFNAGASLIDMEMVQFHPTGLVLPNTPGHGEIFEEEVRMQGGVLLNKDGHRYMFRYDDRGERATRDIVARGSYTEIIEGRGTPSGGVILDLSQLKKDWLPGRFPYMIQRMREHGVDLMAQDRIEISPSAHYLMGGVVIDTECNTDILGLYACGEDAGGIDGGNRLGGNGVAGTLVFGKLAGQGAATYALKEPQANRRIGSLADATPIPYFRISPREYQQFDQQIKQLMWTNVGPVRTLDGLLKAKNRLLKLWDKLERTRTASQLSTDSCTDPRLRRGRVLMNKLQLATLITCSALARTNSVGAHYIKDDDQKDDDKRQEIYNVIVKAASGPLPRVDRHVSMHSTQVERIA